MSETARDSVPEAEQARGDTRARIQAVAVELFSEQGYDKTSLREIAERLGVTKAALYYHFRSKEDIVRSLVDDYFGRVDGVIAWAKQHRDAPGMRDELLTRYLDAVAQGYHVYRMLHQNQAALGSLASVKQPGELFKERMDSLVNLLAGPDATLRARVGAIIAASGLSIGWMFFRDQADDAAELREAVLGIARDIVGSRAGSEAQPAGALAGSSPTAARTSGSTR
jgi:AcrR family transcriptional regulator